MNMRSIRLALYGIMVLFVFLLFEATYFTVEPNELAVVTRFGKIAYVADSGLHFKLPFVNGARFFRTDILSVANKDAVNTYTIDNQEVDINFKVFYRIPANKVEFVYTNARDYEALLAAMAIDRLKVEVGKVNVQSVAEKRGELRDAIHKILAHDAEAIGLQVTDFQLPNLQYADSFRTAVAQAATQKAGIETREYERQQALKTAETIRIRAEGEANAQREQSRGQADSKVYIATAEAKAIQLRGEAEAAAIGAQADALKRNPSMIELRRAERWDGKLPSQVLGQAPIPFMPLPAPAQ